MGTRLRKMVQMTAVDAVRNEIIRKVRQELDRARRNGSNMALALIEIGARGRLDAIATRNLVSSIRSALGWQLRSYDQVFELSQRHLAVVISDVKGPRSTIASIAERLDEAIRLPLRTPQGDIQPDCRISLAIGEAAMSAQELMRRATEASRRPRGETGPIHYDRGVAEEHSRIQSFHEALRNDVESGKIDVVFQPLFDGDDGALVGVEALARWTHLGEPVPPVRFIAHAEETGLIQSLGEAVLRKACEAGARWPNLTVAVNVSPIQLRDPTFPLAVDRVLRETGFPADRLEFEITENVFAGDQPAMSRRLEALRGMGIRIAVDDFGSGYSSFGYLRSFALDRIKIDRSFVTDPGEASRIIVETIVGMGKAMGIPITAEGVETQAQRDFLTERGCERLQGYLLSRPVDASAIDEMVSASVPDGP